MIVGAPIKDFRTGAWFDPNAFGVVKIHNYDRHSSAKEKEQQAAPPPFDERQAYKTRQPNSIVGREPRLRGVLQRLYAILVQKRAPLQHPPDITPQLFALPRDTLSDRYVDLYEQEIADGTLEDTDTTNGWHWQVYTWRKGDIERALQRLRVPLDAIFGSGSGATGTNADTTERESPNYAGDTRWHSSADFERPSWDPVVPRGVVPRVKHNNYTEMTDYYEPLTNFGLKPVSSWGSGAGVTDIRYACCYQPLGSEGCLIDYAREREPAQITDYLYQWFGGTRKLSKKSLEWRGIVFVKYQDEQNALHEQIKSLLKKRLAELNKNRGDFSKLGIEVLQDMSRVAEYIYQYNVKVIPGLKRDFPSYWEVRQKQMEMVAYLNRVLGGAGGDKKETTIEEEEEEEEEESSNVVKGTVVSSVKPKPNLNTFGEFEKSETEEQEKEVEITTGSTPESEKDGDLPEEVIEIEKGKEEEESPLPTPEKKDESPPPKTVPDVPLAPQEGERPTVEEVTPTKSTKPPLMVFDVPKTKKKVPFSIYEATANDKMEGFDTWLDGIDRTDEHKNAIREFFSLYNSLDNKTRPERILFAGVLFNLLNTLPQQYKSAIIYVRLGLPYATGFHNKELLEAAIDDLSEDDAYRKYLEEFLNFLDPVYAQDSVVKQIKTRRYFQKEESGVFNTPAKNKLQKTVPRFVELNRLLGRIKYVSTVSESDNELIDLFNMVKKYKEELTGTEIFEWIDWEWKLVNTQDAVKTYSDINKSCVVCFWQSKDLFAKTADCYLRVLEHKPFDDTGARESFTTYKATWESKNKTAVNSFYY